LPAKTEKPFGRPMTPVYVKVFNKINDLKTNNEQVDFKVLKKEYPTINLNYVKNRLRNA
jgi:hypothetical protein